MSEPTPEPVLDEQGVEAAARAIAADRVWMAGEGHPLLPDDYVFARAAIAAYLDTTGLLAQGEGGPKNAPGISMETLWQHEKRRAEQLLAQLAARDEDAQSYLEDIADLEVQLAARDEELAGLKRERAAMYQVWESESAQLAELAGLRRVAEAAQNVDLVYVGIARPYPSEGDWTVFHQAVHRLHAALAPSTEEPDDA